MLLPSHLFTRLTKWLFDNIFGSNPPEHNLLGVRIAQIASSIVMAIGCLVLIGWQLNLAVLKSVLPAAAAMKANTAVCFVLAGISLKLQTRRPQQSTLASQIANGCAIGITSIATLIICQYLFGWNLGIDELLFRDLALVATSHPGRMGINTAVNFVLMGTALWLMNRLEPPSPTRLQHRVQMNRTTIAQVMTTVALAIALQAAIVYLYNVRIFDRLSIFTTSMALHTAIGFEILGMGMLALGSDRGFMRALTSDLIGGDVARRFIPSALVLPLVVGWLIVQGLQANLYDPNFAMSLMSLSLVVGGLTQIRINAGILNRVDYDRRRWAEQLQASEERLQFALKGTNQGIWDFDVQEQILTWDDRCKAMFGLPPTAVVTFEGYLDALHPDDRQRVADAAALALRECGEFSQEYRTIHADGTIRWVLTQGRCYCNTLGEPARMLGTMMDITARQQIEADLRESEQRFRTLADNMSQLAWMADASGWLFWYNRRWFEYTGTTLEQMQGWGWQQVHHPEHVDRVVQHFQHHLESGEAWEDTFPLRGRDGKYRWFLSRAIPIVDETGRVLRWFGTNTDITEQQTLLSERKQAQADLEQRNQELDSFVYVVAHDLKAPLRGIANLSQWIEDDLPGTLTTEVQQHTVLLRDRVHRMEATIDGLLDYARVGRIDAAIEPVVLSQLLAEVLDSIEPPPTFTIAIAPELPTINTKRLFLSQVFTNLISNAIKHHDRSDGSISISVRDRGDFYEFAVADDGPGISPEHHDRIFVIFQSVNPQRSKDSSGIGLSIVKKIIEAEGGSIWLESQPSHGVTFYFTWPKRADISA